MQHFFRYILIILAICFPLALMAQEAAEEKADDSAEATDKAESEETKAPAAIYLAARDGHLDKVQALIANGADINAVNAQGRSALMSAVYVRNRRIIRQLLMEGADVNTVDALGKTALIIAATTGDLDIVQMLLDAGADVSIEDKSKNTALTIAEKRKNKKLTKLLESASG